MNAAHAEDRIEFGPTIEERDARALLEITSLRRPAHDVGVRLIAHGLALDAGYSPAGIVASEEGWRILAFWRKGGRFVEIKESEAVRHD